MKKTSTLVVGVAMLTCFLIFSFCLNAQTGPRVEFELWGSTFYDSAFISAQTPTRYGFNLHSVGDEPLMFKVTLSNPDFISSFSDSMQILEPGNNTDYIIFRPTTPGISICIVTITTNDPNHEITTYTIQGFGLESPLKNMQSLSNDFKIGTKSTRQIVLENTTPNRAEFHLVPYFAVSELPLTFPIDRYVLDPGQSVLVDCVMDFRDFDFSKYGGTPANFTYDFQLGVDYHAFYEKDHTFFSASSSFTIHADDGSPSMQIIGPAQIEAKISTVTSTSFEITNSGNAELHYSIDADSLITQVDGTRLFSTGFDELEPGAAQSQGGWSEVMYVFYITENQQWKVENINPFLGTQHLRCTTNGMPGSNGVELYSPAPPENTTAIDMMVDITVGSTWQFMARDQDYSSTILAIASDGSLSIVKEYPYDVHSVSSILPDGYFNLRFTINTETHELSITADGVVLYSGFSNATNFTEFSIGLSSETAGVTLDIDNFRFMDSQNIKLLSVEPQFGSIAPLSSKTIDVQVDTRSIDAGTFSEIFTIHSNDPNQPVAYVPVTTVVKPNVLPVLTGNFNPAIVSGESILLTFSALDPDDSLVSITFNNFNGSGNGELVEVASGNGFVTYTIITYGNDQSDGSLQMTILAEDARGGITSKLFRLTLYATGQNDFSLTNFKTGVKVANFTDTITVDVAHADFAKLTIQANASVDGYEGNETTVGFKFIVDGVEINKDQSKPFYLNKGFIQKLSKGYHSLTAVSYYIYDNKEYRIGTGISTIHVINSAAVTRYDVVNTDGVKVMDLTEGSIVDLSQIGTNGFNIIAHTNISSVRSVKFALNNVTARIDNGAPYALAGNALGDTFWKPKKGHYTLSAVPYLHSYGWGVKGVPLTVHFQVVNGSSKPATSIARSGNSTDVEQTYESIDIEDILSVYPVPVADKLHIALHESIKGNVVVSIMNAQGKSLYVREGVADEFRMYSINTVQVGMSRGVYFVIVNQTNGKRVVKKFVKE